MEKYICIIYLCQERRFKSEKDRLVGTQWHFLAVKNLDFRVRLCEVPSQGTIFRLWDLEEVALPSHSSLHHCDRNGSNSFVLVNLRNHVSFRRLL